MEKGLMQKEGNSASRTGLLSVQHGEMFISDRYNFRIQKFDSKGNFQLQWLTSGILDDSKYYPLGIVTGKDNNVYVTDHYAHCILQYKIVQ